MQDKAEAKFNAALKAAGMFVKHVVWQTLYVYRFLLKPIKRNIPRKRTVKVLNKRIKKNINEKRGQERYLK